MEFHAKIHHLYVQCFNDPIIYVIEATSAIVIQTIKVTNEEMISLEIRNTFTVSPCDALIFTKCPKEDQIKCVQITNQEKIGQFRIPISLATRKYTVTSMSYHPTKNLIACSIFGDSISSCLFLMYNDTDGISKLHETSRLDEVRNLDGNIFEEMRNIQTLDMFDGNEIKSGPALASILNRIDDLFSIAIQSPKHTNDYGRLNDMHVFLQKIRTDSIQPEILEPIEQYTGKFMSDSCSDDLVLEEKRNEFINKQKTHRQSQFNSKSPEESESNDSHHTFNIESKSKQISNIDDEHIANSNATFSIPSDVSNSSPSNQTYEIQK